MKTIIILGLIIVILLLNEDIKQKNYDIEFLEWQAQEFADELKKNKIPFAWG